MDSINDSNQFSTLGDHRSERGGEDRSEEVGEEKNFLDCCSNTSSSTAEKLTCQIRTLLLV